MSGAGVKSGQGTGAAINAALLMFILTTSDVWADQSEWISERGIYTVSFQSSLDPIKTNKMHTWVLQVSTSGDPVLGAEFVIVGGMPKHDHGLATVPRVAEELGEGKYRLDGMRFHMNGYWEIVIEIEADGKTDTVIVTLTL